MYKASTVWHAWFCCPQCAMVRDCVRAAGPGSIKGAPSHPTDFRSSSDLYNVISEVSHVCMPASSDRS